MLRPGLVVSLTELLIDLLCSRDCPLCGQATAGSHLCAPCQERAPGLPLAPPLGVGRAWALAEYDGALGLAIRRMKFRRQVWRCAPLGRALGAWLARAPGTRSGWDAVVPVPTSTARIRQRGFDQAERIARGVAQELEVPILSILRRHGHGRQSDRTADERMRVGASLRCSGQAPKRVLLIDDVVTTGHTLEACASLLREAGAARVDAAALAWTARRSPRA